MDQGLFSKHIRAITRRSDAKQDIITHIQTTTGIQLEESEISLTKKKVTLFVSSVKKAALTKRRCSEMLQTLGYTLTL